VWTGGYDPEGCTAGSKEYVLLSPIFRLTYGLPVLCPEEDVLTVVCDILDWGFKEDENCFES
jgi:hypothetical protein